MMKKLSLKWLMLLGCVASVAMAAPPRQLVTHNLTDVESNAYIAGTIPSQYPSHPQSDNKVMWATVRMACLGHITDNKCWALIKMATNTANPVDLGYVAVDLNTGDIDPKRISGNGYTMIVNGPGETTIIQE